MNFITFIDYIGTFVFATSGILSAVNKKFDLFGVFILGFVTAVGGGTMRDLMIGTTPVFWMQNEIYVYITILAVPICYVWKDAILKMKKGIFLFDTLGIGLFTIIGIQKSLEHNLSPLIAIMMGVVSAVFGGVIRDVLANREPLIFRKEIYAFACLIGGCFYFISALFIPENLAIIFTILIVIVIRILAIRKKWELPFLP